MAAPVYTAYTAFTVYTAFTAYTSFTAYTAYKVPYMPTYILHSCLIKRCNNQVHDGLQEQYAVSPMDG